LINPCSTAKSIISPFLSIPLPNEISNVASLNGGAILFLTTFAFVLLATMAPPSLIDSILRTSILTEE
jgi:hypothetical protein